MVAFDEKDLRKMLYSLVPEDGSSIGNKALTGQLTKKGFPVEKYWEIRRHLVELGLLATGRGKGGSVYRPNVSLDAQKKGKAAVEVIPELKLYKPFADYLAKTWINENLIEARDCVIQITANQGKRATGGKWTRPDVTIVVVKTYTYVPGKFLQVVTFEIKPSGYIDVAWVYEAAAHSRYAHKTFLCVHLPGGYDKDDVNLRRLEEECARFRLGLIYFENPDDPETYETLIDPVGQNPSPEQVDDFIRTQLDDKNKEQVLKLK